MKGRLNRVLKFNLFESLNKEIVYTNEHLASYSGQHNYELGAYIDDNIVGLVEYVLFRNQITISNVVVVPEYRRLGIASRMVKKMKGMHPNHVYISSMKTDLGSKFIHKEIDDLDHISDIK